MIQVDSDDRDVAVGLLQEKLEELQAYEEDEYPEDAPSTDDLEELISRLEEADEAIASSNAEDVAKITELERTNAELAARVKQLEASVNKSGGIPQRLVSVLKLVKGGDPMAAKHVEVACSELGIQL